MLPQELGNNGTDWLKPKVVPHMTTEEEEDAKNTARMRNGLGEPDRMLIDALKVLESLPDDKKRAVYDLMRSVREIMRIVTEKESERRDREYARIAERTILSIRDSLPHFGGKMEQINGLIRAWHINAKENYETSWQAKEDEALRQMILERFEAIKTSLNPQVAAKENPVATETSSENR